jgi:hypothetical protein
MSLVAAGNKSNWQRGLNPLLAKNRDDPIVSDASLFAANSPSGSHCTQLSCR